MDLLFSLSMREMGFGREYPCLRKYMEDAAEVSLLESSFQYQLCKLPDNPKSTNFLCLSPNGKVVASCHGNYKIHVSDVRTGKVLHSLEGHDSNPWALAFHPTHNDLLASGSLSGEVRVWDLKTGCCETIQVAVESAVASLAFHPEDRLLVIGVANHLLYWDWHYSEPWADLKTASPRERIRYVKFDRTGSRLYTGITNTSGIRRNIQPGAVPTYFMPSEDMVYSRQQLIGMRSSLARRHQHLVERYNALLERYRELRRRYPAFANEEAIPTREGDPHAATGSTTDNPHPSNPPSDPNSPADNGNGGMDDVPIELPPPPPPPTLSTNAEELLSSYRSTTTPRSSARSAQTFSTNSAGVSSPPQSTIGEDGARRNRINIMAEMRSLPLLTRNLRASISRHQNSTSNEESPIQNPRTPARSDGSVVDPRENISNSARASAEEFLTANSSSSTNRQASTIVGPTDNNVNQSGGGTTDRATSPPQPLRLNSAGEMPPLSPIQLERLNDAVTYAHDLSQRTLSQFMQRHSASMERLERSYRQLEESALLLEQNFKTIFEEITKIQEQVGREMGYSELYEGRNSAGGLLRSLSAMQGILTKVVRSSRDNSAPLVTETATLVEALESVLGDESRTQEIPPQIVSQLRQIWDMFRGIQRDLNRVINGDTDHRTDAPESLLNPNTPVDMCGIQTQLITGIRRVQDVIRQWKSIVVSTIEERCGTLRQTKSNRSNHFTKISRAAVFGGISGQEANTTTETTPTVNDRDTVPEPVNSQTTNNNPHRFIPLSLPPPIAGMDRNESVGADAPDSHLEQEDSERSMATDTPPPSLVAESPSADRIRSDRMMATIAACRRKKAPKLLPNIRISPLKRSLAEEANAKNPIEDPRNQPSTSSNPPSLTFNLSPSRVERMPSPGNNSTVIRYRSPFASTHPPPPPPHKARKLSFASPTPSTSSEPRQSVFRSVDPMSSEPSTPGTSRNSPLTNFLNTSSSDASHETRSSLPLRRPFHVGVFRSDGRGGGRVEEWRSSLPPPPPTRLFRAPLPTQDNDTAPERPPPSQADGNWLLQQPSAASAAARTRPVFRRREHRIINDDVYALVEQAGTGGAGGGALSRIRRRALAGRYFVRIGNRLPGAEREGPDPERNSAEEAAIRLGYNDDDDYDYTHDLHRAINRAIAGAFIGTGDTAIATNILDSTCRIQEWQFDSKSLPDLTDGSKNVIAPWCKVHNDGSVTFSENGDMLACFAESFQNENPIWADTVLQIVSLKPLNKGTVIYQKSFGPNAVSLSFSPCDSHILVGLATRRYLRLRHPPETFAQIFRLSEADNTDDKEKELKLVLNLNRVLPEPTNPDDVAALFAARNCTLNCAVWLRTPGQGFVYGTNKGHLCLITPTEGHCRCTLKKFGKTFESSANKTVYCKPEFAFQHITYSGLLL